ncbi:MAG: hypothetical protein M1819_001481 [Sarea resinae]|nr:MAG: hypothetical protein M1819_001481 [Sarea resinae]
MAQSAPQRQEIGRLSPSGLVDSTAQALIDKVRVAVQAYMSQFDASHDYAHIERVLALALRIQRDEQILRHGWGQPYSTTLITLSALLHDYGDYKYLQPHEGDGRDMAYTLLLSHGADPALAAQVQKIVSHVSYSHEIANSEEVQEVLRELPELAVVQDADRLDAIGAVGIGRVFAYGGAKGRSLDESVAHFGIKLERLEGMMKTETGSRLAKERTRRLRVLREWWEEETGAGDYGERVK